MAHTISCLSPFLSPVTPNELSHGLQRAGLQPCPPAEMCGMRPSLRMRNPLTVLKNRRGLGAFMGDFVQTPSLMGSYLGYGIKPTKEG